MLLGKSECMGQLGAGDETSFNCKGDEMNRIM
jgi:hypothetical protein